MTSENNPWKGDEGAEKIEGTLILIIIIERSEKWSARMWNVRNLISQLQTTGQLPLIDRVINSTEEPSDFPLSSLSDFVYYCPGVEWPSLSLESLYTNRKCEDETFLQIVRFYCCCYPWLFCILFQLLARFAIWFALPLPLSETNILSPVRK